MPIFHAAINSCNRLNMALYGFTDSLDCSDMRIG